MPKQLKTIHPALVLTAYIVTQFIAQLLISDIFARVLVVNTLFAAYTVYHKMHHKDADNTPFSLPLSVLVVSTVLSLMITSLFVSSWLLANMNDGATTEYINTIRSMNPTAYILAIAIIAPIGEECVFRYLLVSGFNTSLRARSKRIGFIITLTVPSLLFALSHATGVHLISGLLFGLALSLLFIYTKSLFVCIIVHSIYNALTLFIAIPSSSLLCLIGYIVSFALLIITIIKLNAVSY